MSPRSFIDVPAERVAVPVLVGLVGPSGSGKTYSMLRLTKGIQEVTGGDIFVIDTESRRSLHYADHFKFRHVEFKAPFGPLDYLAAIEHCARQGAKVIGIDSMSHEHEGPGGVLEMHEREMDRMASNEQDPQKREAKRERSTFTAWAKPKAERQRLINSILQMPISFVFCFRAKEKMKPVPGKQPLALGWMPIAGEEFVYEMTLNLLLPPSSGGVPDLQPKEPGERAMVKVPRQFAEIVRPEPISESLGVKLAEWAKGGAPSVSTEDLSKQIAAELRRISPDDGEQGKQLRKDLLGTAFGVSSWKQVTTLPAGKLSDGLEKLKKTAPVGSSPGTTERLSESQVEHLKKQAWESGIALTDLEECFGNRLAEIEIAGVDAGGLQSQIVAEIRRLADRQRLAKERAEDE